MFTDAALTSQLNGLKSQHLVDEVKKVDDKVTTAFSGMSEVVKFKFLIKEM